ncbi:gastrula zinc finger protein XlCGF57.1 isoform X4 [Syngnathus scovelli]|uniref:gastrula zinc finger protein XlCGF57.1 isoform X4 n=1 Tax=Syngnathus scovelli TaxID=161590 RepID=UPI00211012D7|nr:zinc finger protein OZF isoform X4 [Syngnathus scovelli]
MLLCLESKARSRHARAQCQILTTLRLLSSTDSQAQVGKGFDPRVDGRTDASVFFQDPEHSLGKEETTAAERPHEAGDLGKLTVTCVVVKSEDEEQGESAEKLATDSDADREDARVARIISEKMVTESHADQEDARGLRKLFECPQCDKTYSSKGHLKRHARSHAAADAPGAAAEEPSRGDANFSCSTCRMTFKFHSTFLGHMKKHSGHKSFTCGVCGATFRFQSTFVNHVRTHTGEKPFTCQVCNASFSVHSSLLRHARLHTGEKRFACSFCDKKFPRKASLVEHVRIHTGEKPLSCSVCHMNFRFHSKLVKHMQSHTRGKAFDCHTCGEKFASKLRLDKHVCAGGESGGGSWSGGGGGGGQTPFNIKASQLENMC